MKIYLRILKFAIPFKFFIGMSLISSFLYVLTNGLTLWLIGSLLSSIMNSSVTSFGSHSAGMGFTEKLNSFLFQFFINQNHIGQLKLLCYSLVISFFFKNIFYYINNICLSWAQNSMITELRNAIFKKIQSLPMSFFKRKKSGELNSITMHDVTLMRMTFSQSVQNMINEPLNILFMVAVLFLINFKLAALSFIIIPISGYFTIKLGLSIRRKATRSSKQIAQLMNIVIENVTGIKVVKSFNKEDDQIKQFNDTSRGLLLKNFRLDSLKYLSSPLNDMIGCLIGAIILWHAGKQVLIDQSLTADGFIKFFTFLFAMLQPAKKLANVNMVINRGIASAERVFSILDNKESYNEEGAIDITKFDDKISFKNVNFKYDNNPNLILKNINLDINKGEIVAIVGESGAGKTTFIDLIPRFFDIDAGDIYIDNYNYNNISRKSLRSQIGIVSQESILFNDSIYNNIKFGNTDASKAEIYKAAEMANAIDFINVLPKKFSTIVGEKGTKLSGGQKQRIAIARALIKNPNILIFDEATSALDSKSELKIKEAIDNLVKDRTVIVIAHRLSTILNATKIVVMDQGEIIEIGNHDELIMYDGLYKKLYDLQLRKNNNES